MNILPHFEPSNYLKEIFSSVQEKTLQLISPMNQNFSIHNYSAYIEDIGALFQTYTCDTLVHTIHSLDEKFKHSSLRKRDYYIHQSRERTLITVFGVIRFKRTLYKNKIYWSFLFILTKKVSNI